MISLETYNRSQLEKLINSERFKEFSFLPISFHRAISHIKNPNLEDDTPVLILAFEDNNLAGYIGILADHLIHKNQKIQVGWLSTLFVHPDFRGKRIAQKLLSKACDEYRGKILITEFTPEAENMYRKSGFFTYQSPLKGMSYHFLSDLQKILPAKNKKWNTLIPFLKLFDYVLNSFVKLFNRIRLSGKEEFTITKSMDKESEDFIKQHKKHNSFNRTFTEIDWIVKNPWILNGADPEKRQYQFSAFEKKFEYLFIKIYENKILQTLLILSVRNTNAKLHFIIGDRNPLLSSQILHQFAVKNNITNLICFEEDVNQHFSKRNILFRKERYRNFLMHKNLQEIVGSDFIFDVSAGDGDAIFT